MRCEGCQRFYDVLKSSRSIQSLIIDFAQCPFCGIYRRPVLRKQYEDKQKCLSCNVPICLSRGRRVKDLCERCYIVLWRKNRAMSVS